jgi:uncharacterized protein with HEPN domain
MRPEEMDAARLWDMLVYAREIEERASGISAVAFAADVDRRLATERRLEIIGEAARHVSRAFQEAHPEVPWRSIIGLRNVLAHEYGEVREGRLLQIVRHNIPDLVRLLTPLVPPPPLKTDGT